MLAAAEGAWVVKALPACYPFRQDNAVNARQCIRLTVIGNGKGA